MDSMVRVARARASSQKGNAGQPGAVLRRLAARFRRLRTPASVGAYLTPRRSPTQRQSTSPARGLISSHHYSTGLIPKSLEWQVPGSASNGGPHPAAREASSLHSFQKESSAIRVEKRAAN